MRHSLVDLICLTNNTINGQRTLKMDNLNIKYIFVKSYFALQVTPPCYQIFPVVEANEVFDKLNACKIHGRAVLQVCELDDDDLA